MVRGATCRQLQVPVCARLLPMALKRLAAGHCAACCFSVSACRVSHTQVYVVACDWCRKQAAGLRK